MSIETIVLANTKAIEGLTEALTALVPALAGAKKTAAKDKTTASTAADPAATSAAPAGAAAGSAAGATTAIAAQPAILDPKHPFALAVQALARAHGRDAAIESVNKFGGEGRASNVKEIDREKCHQYVLSEHKRLDDIKAAAAVATQPKQDDSLI